MWFFTKPYLTDLLYYKIIWLNYEYFYIKNMYLFSALQPFFFLLMYTIIYSEYMYRVRGICTSDKYYSNEVPSSKHVISYNRAGRVDSFSLIFHTP